MKITHTIPLLMLGLAACGGGQVPAAPTELKVSLLMGGGHLTWKDNSDNETQFMIERKAGGGSFQTLVSVPFNTTQYHDAPLTAGTVYTYRVMAMGQGGHSGGSSDFSNEVSLTP